MFNRKQIQSGITVTQFLQDINDNFENISNDLNNINETKQSNIYIMANGDTNGDITISSDGKPSGGKPGDIVIIYDEQN